MPEWDGERKREPQGRDLILIRSYYTISSMTPLWPTAHDYTENATPYNSFNNHASHTINYNMPSKPIVNALSKFKYISVYIG